MSLRPSRLLAAALIFAHGAALAAAWLGLGGWARFLAAAGILASLGWSLMKGRMGPSALELHEDGVASWRSRRGEWQEGRLGRNHFVSAALVVLELETAGDGRRRVLLMGDSTSPGDFRRLRVWLRWRRSPVRPEPE